MRGVEVRYGLRACSSVLKRLLIVSTKCKTRAPSRFLSGCMTWLLVAKLSSSTKSLIRHDSLNGNDESTPWSLGHRIGSGGHFALGDFD